MPGTLTARFESMKRGNTRWSTFSYSWKRKGANLSHTNSTRICWTKCQILEEKTVMRAKEATQSPRLPDSASQPFAEPPRPKVTRCSSGPNQTTIAPPTSTIRANSPIARP